jgi:hypothetical protein
MEFVAVLGRVGDGFSFIIPHVAVGGVEVDNLVGGKGEFYPFKRRSEFVGFLIDLLQFG